MRRRRRRARRRRERRRRVRRVRRVRVRRRRGGPLSGGGYALHPRGRCADPDPQGQL